MLYKEILECYSAMRKEHNLPFATTGTGLEHIMISEIRETEKDKRCMISLMWNVKKSQTHKKQTVNGGYQGMGAKGTKRMLFKAINLQQTKPQRSNAQYNQGRQQQCTVTI